MFYMGHLPLSYQLDLCRLRFCHYMYYNFLSGDEIVWHVANAVNRRLIDQLFCSYHVYISGSVASYSRAVWSELPDHVLVTAAPCYCVFNAMSLCCGDFS